MSSSETSGREEKRSDETSDPGYFSNPSGLAFSPGQTPTIEAWSSSRDHYRVVAFGSAKTMPLQKHRIPDGQEIPWTEEIMKLILECLTRWRIKWTIIGPDRISSKVVLPNTVDEPMDTVVIETVNHDPNSFKQAATEIYQIFTAIGRPEFTLQVEIRNSALMAANTSIPLPDDRVLLQAIEDAQQTILQRVKLYCERNWTSIAFHMRGNRLQQDNLATPTVVVFSLKPENGSSIGGKGNTTQAGSVGCWLKLKLTDGTELPVLLTCYHVFSSEDKVVKDKIDREGMHYGDTVGTVVVQYPAAFDLDANLKDIKGQANPSPRAKGKHSRLKHLSSMSEIGHVIAASGIRLNSCGRRMDWALILSPNSYRKNALPPDAALHRNALPVGGEAAYAVHEGEEVRGISQMEADAWLVKKGRTSGVTSGRVSKHDRLVHWESINMISHEREVSGLVAAFADPGDDGSMVTDQYGGLAGLLIGSHVYSNDNDPGFVTPFHEIQEDVKLYTNGGTLSLA